MSPTDLPATVDPTVVERVLTALGEATVVDLALQLGSIDSPAGAEREAAELVYRWRDREGFAPRRLSLLPERVNAEDRLLAPVDRHRRVRVSASSPGRARTALGSRLRRRRERPCSSACCCPISASTARRSG